MTSHVVKSHGDFGDGPCSTVMADSEYSVPYMLPFGLRAPPFCLFSFVQEMSSTCCVRVETKGIVSLPTCMLYAAVCSSILIFATFWFL